MTPLPDGVVSRFVLVDGVRTHYLEAGAGRPLVLLHDGGFGGAARLTWFMNIAALASQYRVIAPDWLGFGDTDKLYDFGGNRTRRLRHMTRFLEAICVDEAAFIGCSMGATLLLQVAATGEQPWPIAALVSISGGGFVPLNDARKRALSFDCTLDSMRTVVSTYVHQQQWLDDPRMVEERFAQAISPGAWEAVAAARFKSPVASEPRDFGAEDTTPYAHVAVPTMLAAGSHDVLREPDYAVDVAAAIPDVVLHLYQQSGHMPQIEEADDFNRDVLKFLAARYPS